MEYKCILKKVRALIKVLYNYK